MTGRPTPLESGAQSDIESTHAIDSIAEEKSDALDHIDGSESSTPTSLNGENEKDVLEDQRRPSSHTADAQGLSQQESRSSPPPPPNGGYGWVCTACCALINGHTWGLNSTYGVFLAHYLANDTFAGATRLDYAFVGGLSISVAMLVSPIATTTTRFFGTHTTLSIGIFFETASFIGASFASRIWQLFLSQGVCFGLGMGFLFVGSVPIVSQWFTTKRSLANGIMACGSGIGGLVYSLATGAMIKSIGLGWAFRILGIICFVVNTICTILVRDRNKILGTSQATFDTKILRRPEYLLIAAWGFLSMLGYVVLIFSLANYANAIGLSSSQASLISALFNLGQALGRPPIGYFSDNIGRLNMAGGMTFLAGLFALVIWNFADNYGVLIFYALIGGTVAGTFWCTISPVMAEVVGLRHNASGLNLTWLIISLPTLFSEPIALEIVAGSGDTYRGTILFTGFMYIAASLCVLLLRGWKVGELEYLTSLDEADAADGARPKAEIVGRDENLDAKKAGRRTFWKYFWKLKRI